jgi:2-polyprenyl-3-methyl-5-hydroxy-6-metoxy-1,4-benzoquinol methylase
MSDRGLGERDLFYDRMVESADWDQVANPYETARRMRVVFEQLLGDTRLEGLSLLDGGSGGGHFSARARSLGARVVSLDVGRHLLAQVARICDSARVRGSLLDLPFGDGSFEVVLSTEAVEHTPDPIRAVRELARVVAPGGVLAFTTPSRLWQPVVRAASFLRLRPYQGRENFLWPRDAVGEIRRAGLVLDRVRGFNLLPLFAERLERLHRLADRAGGLMPAAFVNFAIRARRPA